MRTLFAIEICIEIDQASEPFVDAVRSYAETMRQNGSRAVKAMTYRNLSQGLLTLLPSWRRGIWDYSDDDAEAKRMFADYAEVLTTKKGARTSPSRFGGGGPMRSSGGPFYANVTFAWLLPTRNRGVRVLARACDVPQDALWKRSTLQYLLQIVPLVAPSCIESDVFYAIPGDASYLLTAADLAGPDFDYLRVLD